jgi:DNA polymerase-3 subunit epsilon/ATP-dependent DNA helicase DinG
LKWLFKTTTFFLFKEFVRINVEIVESAGIVKDERIQRLQRSQPFMTKLFSKTCVALDIETTDLSPDRGEIIEVAAVKFKGEKIINKFRSLVNPGQEIPPVISSITGITPEKVKKAPFFDDIKNDLRKFLSDHPIVGHNISFDINFLRAKEFKLTNQRFDTWKFATLLIPELSSHSLETLTSFLKIKHIESHRALDDVLASRDLFLRLVKKVYEIDINVLKNICSFLVGRHWDLAEIFKKIFKLRIKSGEQPKTVTRKLGIRRQHVDMSPSVRKEKGKEAKRKIAVKYRKEDPTREKIRTNLLKIEKLFKEKEKIKKVIKKYEFRPGQIDLMKKIVEIFERKGKAIIGVGPGIGRDLAYLISSAYFAKGSGRKVALTVSSYELQKKLFDEEVEIAERITPFDFNSCLLEKREKYLCLRRFELLKNKKDLSGKQINSLVKLLLWLPNASLGLFSEVAWIYEDYETEEKVNCNEKFCLKEKCPLFLECFYYKALNRAKKADIILFNYDTFLANPAVKEGVRAKNVIIDEAHKLEARLTDFLSYQINEEKIAKKLSWLDSDPGFLRMIPRKILLRRSTKIQLTNLGEKLARIKDQLTLFFGILGIFVDRLKAELPGGDIFTLSLDADVRQYPNWEKVEKAGSHFIFRLYNFLSNLDKLIRSLKQKQARAIQCDLSGVYKEIYGVAGNLKRMILEPRENDVVWLMLRDDRLSLFLSHLSIKNFVSGQVVKGIDSICFISSVLKAKGEFDYFKKRLGLKRDFEVLGIEPHYEYERQVKIFIPVDISEPTKPEFGREAEEIIKRIVRALGGRTIVSFNSHSALRRVFNNISLALKKEDIKVLALRVSGGWAKLLDEFVKNPKTLFLVTHDFLVKNEIPEKSLACLVVYKLPFEIVSHPLLKARRKGYVKEFEEFILPEALIKFRQIFQRLIRSSKDKGFFVILDKRVESTKYGTRFIESLPSVNVEYNSKDKVPSVLLDWFRKVVDK